MRHGGHPIAPEDRFEVVASGFLAEGGDLYDAFPEATRLRTLGKVSDVVLDTFVHRESSPSRTVVANGVSLRNDSRLWNQTATNQPHL